MEKLNLPPFYVGQKVIHVGTPWKFLGVNTHHKVTWVKQLFCGCWSIDVDNSGVRVAKAPTVECLFCKKSGPNDRIHEYGWDPNDFRAIEEQKFPLITFEKIKETEKHEILIPN